MTNVERHALQLILQGKLRLSDRGVVQHLSREDAWQDKISNQEHEALNGRHRYSFKMIDGRTSTVYKNRLVWMLIHHTAVPEGYVVEHIDQDPTNDSPDNLELMEAVDSHRQGHERLLSDNFYRLCNWFILLREKGREPTEAEILADAF